MSYSNKLVFLKDLTERNRVMCDLEIGKANATTNNAVTEKSKLYNSKAAIVFAVWTVTLSC